MTFPDADRLIGATLATWPAASTRRLGPWTLRGDSGAGRRTACATTARPVTDTEIGAACAAMQTTGQRALFLVPAGADALDRQLQAAGCTGRLNCHFFAAPAADLAARDLPHVAAFTIWEPLAIMCDIWDEAGIGPARREVMHRLTLPKTGVLGRTRDCPAGAAFVAADADVAMLQAVFTRPPLRRAGTARHMAIAAARWAVAAGADTLALAVEAGNDNAIATYAALGLTPAGGYHYRWQP